MKKPDLKFLIKLHSDIERGCTILQVERPAFTPALDRFFDTVSLGIEMGLRMKGKPKAAAGKPAPKGKTGKKSITNGHATGHSVVVTLIKALGTKALPIPTIEERVKKASPGIKSKNLRAYLSSVLSGARDKTGKKIFAAVERGVYRVATAKDRSKKVTKKLKAKSPKKRAVKAKGKKVTNGHAKTGAATVVAASALN